MSALLEARPMNARVPEVARQFTRAVVERGGGSVVSVLLYGSQLHRSSPNRYSAWDLVVVVRDYTAFHLAMHESGAQRRGPVFMNLLAPVLPPYVTAFSPPELDGGIAKCLVLSEGHFRWTLGPNARDHLMKGRFVQHVEVVWTASDVHAAIIEECLQGVRREVLDWAGPFVDEPFDAEALTQRMLTVSFAAEFRPEPAGRVMELWRNQAEWLVAAYRPVLSDAEARGILEALPGGGYRFVRPAGWWRRLRLRLYFLRSKARVTARWAKHVVTFNDWLHYVKRKVERRTGLTIELTPAEERWPLILLWPKAIKVLRHGRTEGSDEEETP